jgi:hypothetical protein
VETILRSSTLQEGRAAAALHYGYSFLAVRAAHRVETLSSVAVKVNDTSGLALQKLFGRR